MKILKKGIVIILTVSLLLPGYHTLFETVIAEAKTFTRNEQDKAALEKIIKEQRALGSEVSQDIGDSEYYEWNENGRLVGISWRSTGLSGNITFSEFPELVNLQCSNNYLTGIDIYQNTKLKQLDCRENRILQLDVSNNTEMESLSCEENYLSNLDLKNNGKLQELGCSANKLRNLDLRNNTILEYLHVDEQVCVTGLRSECKTVVYNNSFFDENGFRCMIDPCEYEEDSFDEEYFDRYANSRNCIIAGYENIAKQEVLVVPNTVVNPINGAEYQVVGVGDRAFARHNELKKVRLEEGIEFIENDAFLECGNLEDFFIPNSVKNIWGYAFAGCEKLSGLVLPSDLHHIARDFFGNNLSKEVTLYMYYDSKNQEHDLYINEEFDIWWEREYNVYLYSVDRNKRKGVTGVYTRDNICYELYDDNTCVVLYVKEDINKGVSLPDKIIDETTGKEYTVTGIASGAFSQCKALKSITISDSMKKIEENAFEFCSSLESITMPDSVEEIGKEAFLECKSLKSITIPDRVKKIGERAFLECKSLKSVTLPNSLKEIGKSAFRDCSSLESINIPGCVKKIESGTFLKCSSLKVVSISNGVQEIESGAFEKCKKLAQIVIPKSVAIISKTAFKKFTTTRLTIVAPKGSKAYSYGKKAGIMTTESKKIKFSPNNIEMYLSESTLLYAYNAPGVVYKSSNKSVATISEYGQLEAKKSGKTTITATVLGKKYKLPLRIYKRNTRNVLRIIYKRYVKKEMSDYEKIEAAHKWLIENVKYDPLVAKGTGRHKNGHDAKGAFANGIAVCDGYAKAFQKIMKHYGIPCKIIYGTGNGGGHAWNLVKIKDKWYHVDCTFDDPIILNNYNNKKAYDMFFLKTDKYMRNNLHSWNAKSYPKANSKKIDKKYRKKK